MQHKRFSLRSALAEILRGLAIGAGIGVAVVIRQLTGGKRRPEASTDGAADAPSAQASATTHAAEAEPPADHARPTVQLRPGWQRVEHEALPSPSYWPAVLAFGITLLSWGILTTWLISAVGLIVFVLALIGWIGELRHGH